MVPWLVMLAGALLVVWGLYARQRMLRGHDRDEETNLDAGDIAASVRQEAPQSPSAVDRVEPVADERAPMTSAGIARAAESVVNVRIDPDRMDHDPGAAPFFADLPDNHRLTGPPMLRVRSSEVPLLDWLRYYSDGNAWSGVVTRVASEISADPTLAPYVRDLDRATLQRHVMSLLMVITGEGVTVGAVRRLERAHLDFVADGGPPINDRVWDLLMSTLRGALRDQGVRESVVASLDETVEPMRSVIVARTVR